MITYFHNQQKFTIRIKPTSYCTTTTTNQKKGGEEEERKEAKLYILQWHQNFELKKRENHSRGNLYIYKNCEKRVDLIPSRTKRQREKKNMED